MAVALQHRSLGVPSQPKQPLPPSRWKSSNQLRFLPGTHRKSTEFRTGLAVVHVATREATFYDRLELSPNVGLSDIKKAYRQMARRYHPDVCPSNRAEESTRRFIEIQEAYETLSDPRSRAVYDHAVAMGRGSAATGRMPWSPRDKDGEAADWKCQWEIQLSELRGRSSIRERQAVSWAARMRQQNGR